MSIKKVLVIGYFGYKNNQLDGQTVKTRNIYELFKKYSKDDVSLFDTQSFQKSKFKLIKLTLKIINSDVIYYLPAQKNLKYIFPIVCSVSKASNTKINYLVVGGWLIEFLKDKALHKYLLSKIKGIYVETDTLYKGLTALGLKNVFKLHNFRMDPYPDIRPSELLQSEIRLIFMARVNPKKGVNVLFELEKELKREGWDSVTIDIYGPIEEGYTTQFYDKLQNSSIRYKGIIDPKHIHNILQRYDLLLFPTKYYTEGFPGTILDSYISGLPVITTNWLNAAEFVKNGESGYITPFNDNKAFIKQVFYVLENPTVIKKMKSNALDLRDKYSPERAWKILSD